MHPPYGAEIGISYAGSMFPDPTGQLRQSDLGQMKWDAFMSELNSIIMKYYAAMSPGARMSILMGAVRRNQKFHSMLCDVVKPGILEQVLIKAQYNTYSERNGFVTQNRGFYPIQHEYIMVVKKSGGYIVTFKIPKTACLDIRDSEDATWRDVVLSVLNELGTSTLKNIYEQIDGHNKARNNTHWKEKIRQTLQRYACFSSIGSGKWQVVA